MAIEFTPAQKNAINAHGRVLVSAAAGSGKTAVLVERAVRLITDEVSPVNADRLLIVTFTKPAAAEMRERISLRLSEIAREHPENERLQRQRILIKKAAIGTIDSFCNTLVKEYFYKLDVPASFSLGDNGAIQNIYQSALDTVLGRAYEKEDEDFLTLISMFEHSDYKLREAIMSMYLYTRSIPYVEKFFECTNKMYENITDDDIWFSAVYLKTLSKVTPVINRFTSLLCDMDSLDEDDPMIQKGVYDHARQCYTMLCKVKDAAESKDWDGAYHTLKYFSAGRFPTISKYHDPDFKELVKSACDGAKSAHSSLKKIFYTDRKKLIDHTNATYPAIKVLQRIITEYEKEVFSRKCEQGILGFDDVERAALELLVDENGDYTEVSRELSAKYAEVMVDEYQDTNDLQNAIFLALSDGGKKMFSVGDVKQCIYRFRQANPKNFLALRESLPDYTQGSTDSKVVMSGNFRSDKSVCDYVNFVFEHIMSKNATQMDYLAEDALDPHADINGESGVMLRLIDNADKDLGFDAESAYIADFIKKKIAETNESSEPYKYSDFCVLLRSRGKAALIGEELYAAGIPYWTDEFKNYFELPEIKGMISFLQCIDNPHKDIPLLATMLGDVYMISTDEVAKARAACKNTDLYTSLLQFRKNSVAIDEFLASLERYRTLTVSSSVSQLIRRIYDETGFMNICSLKSADAASNLYLFAERAESFEKSGGRGLCAFIRYIEKAAKRDKDAAGASAVCETDNVVRIMTDHHSKGLQFRVTIIADITKPFNTSDEIPMYQINSNSGIGISYMNNDSTMKYPTLPQMGIVASNAAESKAEEVRVLYVALTRAQNILMVTGTFSNLAKTLNTISESILPSRVPGRTDEAFVRSSRSPADLLLATALLHPSCSSLRDYAGLNFAPDIAHGEIDTQIIDAYDLCSFKGTDTDITPAEYDATELLSLKKRLAYEYPHKGVNEIAAKQSASAIAHAQSGAEYYFTGIPMFMNSGKPGGAARGTAVHKFMEICDFAQAEHDVSAEILRLYDAGKLNKEENDCIDVNKVQNFFSSPIYNRIKNSDKLYREFEFMTEMPAYLIEPDTEVDKSEMIVIQGVVDCAFVENNEMVIVDYKTDRGKTEQQLKDQYGIQLKIYAYALKEVLGHTVKQLYLYSFELGKEINIEF